MKIYTYKVVGVTFDGKNGSRQRVLKKLFNAAAKDEFEDYELEFEEYEFEGSPALLVLLDDLDVGNIAADKVEEVIEINKKCDQSDVELAVNGMSVDDYLELKENWRTRKQDLKDGIIDEYYIDEMEEQLEEIKDDPIYSAQITFYIKEPEDDIPAVPEYEPEPEPPKKRGLFGLFRK